MNGPVVDMTRRLTLEQAMQVRARCLALQMAPLPISGDDLRELRWADGYAALYVLTTSKVMELLHGNEGVIDRSIKHVLVDRSVPLVRSILGAIEEVVTGGQYASSEARGFYGDDR